MMLTAERSARFRSFRLGFALVLLIAALAGAAMSFVLAATAVCAGECVAWHGASRIAWSVVVGSALLLALLGTGGVLRRRGRDTKVFSVAAGVALAAVATVVVSWGVWRLVGDALDAVPVMSAVPLAAAAAIALIIGAISVIVWHGGAEPGDHHFTESTAIGGVVALVVAAGLGGSTWYLGADSRYVESTTTSGVAVPAPPTALGTKRFAMRIADRSASVSIPLATVVAAGAGFVVQTDSAVTTYKSAGVQRWQYRRDGAIGSVATYDAGRTVVASLWGSGVRFPALIGLDALTGRTRWLRADPVLAAAFGGPSAGPAAHLISGRGSSWTGFDPGSGGRLWQIPNPLRCMADSALTVNTDAVFAAVESCASGGISRFRVVAVEPGTGEILLDKTLPVSTATAEIDRVSTSRAGTSGLVLHVATKTGHIDDLFVNARTGDTAPLGDGREPLQVFDTGPGGDGAFLVSRGGWPDETVSIHNADGSLRCSLPPGQGPYSERLYTVKPVTVAWLGDQIAFYAPAHDGWLRAAMRTDCAVVSTFPLAAPKVWQVVGAPGVTLVVRTDVDGTYLDGYGPA
jgi:hypothetical protein